MVQYIETTGRTEEDAIAAALIQLGLERDDVSIEVLVRARSGFFGFGSSPARVKVSYETDESGKPRPMNYLQEDILSSVRAEPEKKPEPQHTPEKPAPEKKSAPRTEKPAEKPEAPAKPAGQSAPETPAAVPEASKAAPEEPGKAPEPGPKAPEPEEEETILAAKPGWQPARSARSGRRSQNQKPQGSRRDSRNSGQSRKPNRNGGLRPEDEILMAPPPAPVERPPHHEPILSPVSEDDEKARRIREFLIGLMEHLNVQAEPEIMITDEGNYKVRLVGENLGSIIGRRGETLDAIQQLTSYAVNRGQSKRVRIHVDAEGYRARREESLKRLAEKTASKVVKYRRNIMLEPMNAYERHVIHTALQEYPGVTTYSTGVEPNRRTIIAYAPDLQK